MTFAEQLKVKHQTHTPMYTLIEIARNKINALDRNISAVFPGATLVGHCVNGKTVAKRAILVTPKGMDAKAIIKAAGLKTPAR
jgi:TRAP-type uncharacterized transport system substrate-binding protein